MNLYKDKIPNITLICAPPESGKTYLIKYLISDLFKAKKLKYGLCFCPTSFGGDFDYLPQKYIHTFYNEDIVKNLMDIQISQISQFGKAEPAFIIFDDCIGAVNLKSKFIMQLFSTYRHYNILIIITTQYLKKIDPLIRVCANFFITFCVNDKKTLTEINDTYCHEMNNYKQVHDFIKKHTQDYHFLLIEPKKAVDKKYTVYKAPKIKKNLYIDF
jgi:hypothetical protein